MIFRGQQERNESIKQRSFGQKKCYRYILMLVLQENLKHYQFNDLKRALIHPSEPEQ